MLALIALANVPFWVRFFPDHPEAGRAALAAMTDVDQWWFLLRALFVDRRAYPLFSILFGFGMAIMAKRMIERERRVAREALPAELSAGWIPLQWQFYDEDVERRARRAASRLIRRRGWWMLAFGAVHSVIFQGDIIGAYGLVAVIFAEGIVMRRGWLRARIGASSGSDGTRCRTTALMPAICGVAIEVPDVCSYAPFGIAEKTLPPGAAISGFRRRSGVTPHEEKSDIEYLALGVTVLPSTRVRWWSAASSMALPLSLEMKAAGTSSVVTLMIMSESPATLL